MNVIHFGYITIRITVRPSTVWQALSFGILDFSFILFNSLFVCFIWHFRKELRTVLLYYGWQGTVWECTIFVSVSTRFILFCFRSYACGGLNVFLFNRNFHFVVTDTIVGDNNTAILTNLRRYTITFPPRITVSSITSAGRIWTECAKGEEENDNCFF